MGAQIFRTHRQIYREVLPVLWGENTFSLWLPNGDGIFFGDPRRHFLLLTVPGYPSQEDRGEVPDLAGTLIGICGTGISEIRRIVVHVGYGEFVGLLTDDGAFDVGIQTAAAEPVRFINTLPRLDYLKIKTFDRWYSPDVHFWKRESLAVDVFLELEEIKHVEVEGTSDEIKQQLIAAITRRSPVGDARA
ncbi:MAG: hypothetical protein MMC23_000333 [Stictis urceolatum]|nr:hypothetical protein [Stictis urceolata]